MIKKVGLLSFTLLATTVGISQDILFEETFSTGIPATWTLVNEDELTPNEAVSEFTQAWIPFIYDLDTCAASTSYYNEDGITSDYLISPKISLGNYSRLIWSAKSVDASYPDGYVVLISTTDSLIGSFTDTLMEITAEPNYFTERGVELDLAGYANQDVFITFKNNSNGGYILLLDKVTVFGSEFASTPNNEEVTVTIYPNPVSDVLNIQTDSDLISTNIYSLQGSLILSTTSNRIDMHSFENGMYIIEVQTTNGTTKNQIVKNN